ncbi:sugar ABC transporter permease, partial [Blautia pseudococcoides]|nr:sugar ABC transporter permease [Blautia pseudococcoides]
MKKMIKYWNKPSRSAYLFLAPSVILLILFSVVPLIIAFGLSLFDVSITMDSACFIGLENFAEAFQDSRFINSLKVTAIFTGLEVPLQVLGALVVAALIAKNN